jgi:hypothetical protein
MNVHRQPFTRHGVNDLFLGGEGDVKVIHIATIAQEAPAQAIQARLQHGLVQPALMRVKPNAPVARVDCVVRTTGGASEYEQQY